MPRSPHLAEPLPSADIVTKRKREDKGKEKEEGEAVASAYLSLDTATLLKGCALSLFGCSPELTRRNGPTVLKAVSTHKYAGPFLQPVTYEEAPDYDNVIKRRMDLSTIRHNLLAGVSAFSLSFDSG
jgi:hypothetical protein